MEAQGDTCFVPRFHVYPRIIFEAIEGRNPRKQDLIEALKAADRQHPWEMVAHNGDLLPSIRWHSKPKKQDPEHGKDTTRWIINIRLGDLLAEQQLRAYCKYLETIAETISKGRRIDGVAAVTSGVSFTWGTAVTFICPWSRE